METPIEPRTTRPCSRSCAATHVASLIETAHPMGALPPTELTIAVLTPRTRPSASTSGPPELAAPMAASVWMKSSDGPAPSSRPFPLTIPALAILDGPDGLPRATAHPPARLEETGVTDLERREATPGRDTQERDIGAIVAPDHLCVELLVVETHPEMSRTGHHMLVGQDLAVVRDDEPRPEAPPGAW